MCGTLSGKPREKGALSGPCRDLVWTLSPFSLVNRKESRDLVGTLSGKIKGKRDLVGTLSGPCQDLVTVSSGKSQGKLGLVGTLSEPCRWKAGSCRDLVGTLPCRDLVRALSRDLVGTCRDLVTKSQGKLGPCRDLVGTLSCVLLA